MIGEDEMQENNQPRRQQKENQTSINGWKWAFILLVTLIIGLFIYLAVLIQPVSINEPNREPIPAATENDIELSAQMNKADTEQLINTYLNEAIGEDFKNYHLALTDQLEIHGYIDVFGLEVPFALYLAPFVQENGNIQLRGESVELANFSLPVSGVMSLVASQIEFPEFIALDSEDQVIFIQLNKLTEAFNFDIEMTKIDLEADELELNLRVSEEAMLEQIQLESSNNQ